MIAQMMRSLVFDLDQTLIRGEEEDWSMWLGACALALGVPVSRDLDWSSFPVHTDHGLLSSLSLLLRGREVSTEEVRAFEGEVEGRVAQALTKRPALFVPVAGALDLIELVTGKACIATGNLRVTTRLKLRSAGLDRYDLPAACSEDARSRSDLVAHALRQVGWRPGMPATSFGDGVWDVRAARRLGVGFVGVAQSDGHELRLRQEGARHVVRDFLKVSVVAELAEAALPPVA